MRQAQKQRGEVVYLKIRLISPTTPSPPPPQARTSSLIALSLRTSSDLDFSHHWRDSKWLCFARGRAPSFCLATHLRVPAAAAEKKLGKESEDH